jgi:hypothetical protein
MSKLLAGFLVRRSECGVAALLLLLTGCGVEVTGTPAVPAATTLSTTAATATTGTPIPLPFETTFPDRWNGANDGSPFEPCVAFSDSELVRFRIDPATIEDAAIVNGQGIRGCRWLMPDLFSISSLVTNSDSLNSYRDGTKENNWRANLEVNGRVVGLFATEHGVSSTCSTYVQSYSAGVVTNVVTSTSTEGQAIDACKLAEDFTRAYIDKIPG